MDDKFKELVKELLADNLTIKLENELDYDYDKLRVTVLFDGEEIDSSYVYTKGGLIK